MSRFAAKIVALLAILWAGSFAGRASADDYNTAITAPATATAGVPFQITVTADGTVGNPPDPIDMGMYDIGIYDGLLFKSGPTIVAGYPKQDPVTGKVTWLFDARVFSTGNLTIAFTCLSSGVPGTPHQSDATKAITVSP